MYVVNSISQSNIGRKWLWTSKSIGGLCNQLTLPQSDSICALCKPSLSEGWIRKDKITKPQKNNLWLSQCFTNHNNISLEVAESFSGGIPKTFQIFLVSFLSTACALIASTVKGLSPCHPPQSSPVHSTFC